MYVADVNAFPNGIKNVVAEKALVAACIHYSHIVILLPKGPLRLLLWAFYGLAQKYEKDWKTKLNLTSKI